MIKENKIKELTEKYWEATRGSHGDVCDWYELVVKQHAEEAFPSVEPHCFMMAERVIYFSEKIEHILKLKLKLEKQLNLLRLERDQEMDTLRNERNDAVQSLEFVRNERNEAMEERNSLCDENSRLLEENRKLKSLIKKNNGFVPCAIKHLCKYYYDNRWPCHECPDYRPETNKAGE
jgi:hypothetical protein